MKMIDKITGCSVVNDYLRRGIKPDKKEIVYQGLLLMWLFNNSFVCELRINAETDKKQPGEVSIKGGPYINTYSPQEIASDLENGVLKHVKS